MKPAAGGWHDPATAHWYRSFERRHGRYRHASAALARQAALAPGLRVLDLAAGTGATAAALLPALGEPLRLDCVEPARPMREAGQARLGLRPGLRWLATLDEAEGPYDRIVCSAAIWQWAALAEILHTLAGRLAPGGALVFNVPAAYLGQPDGPGGGADPWLLELPARLGPPAATAAAAAPLELRSIGLVERALADAGLWARRWSQTLRLGQAAWRDWHKIPVITDARWPGVDATERARRIDAAAQGLDMRSWRPERWLGWTAWKPAFALGELPGFDAVADGDADADSGVPAGEPAWLQTARAEGVVLLRRLLPRRPLQALRRAVHEAAERESLVDRHGRWIDGRAQALHGLPRWLALQQSLALLPAYQALVHAPQLVQRVSRLIGRPAQGGQGSVCRIAAPEHWVPATPPHCDASYLRQPDDVWSAWLPLTDCPVQGGVLAVAAGSHHSAEPGPWAAAAMKPGDVLLLSARTLHRACPNLSPQQPRLSVDLRFGPA